MTDISFVPLGTLLRSVSPERAGEREFPILSMTMHGGLVDQADKFKKRIASSDTSEYKVVSRNQLVVGFPIDEGVLSVQDLYDLAIVSPAYDVWGIETARVLPEYLERFLRSPVALRYYALKLQGTTARRRTLPDDLFLALPVPLPPLTDQRRIASILDNADAIRRRRRDAIKLAEQLLQSMFLETFGDPLTNPKRWPVKRLDALAEVTTGNTPPRAEAEHYGDVVEWLKSDNLGHPDPHPTVATEWLSSGGSEVARLAVPGSTLITCIAGSRDSIGKCSLLNRSAAFNQQINAVTPHDPALGHFTYAFFRCGKRLVQDKSTDSMKGLVSKSRLQGVMVFDVPPKLASDFSMRFSHWMALLRKQEDAAREADALVVALARQFFSPTPSSSKREAA